MGLLHLTLNELLEELEKRAYAATKGEWTHRTAPGFDEAGFVQAPRAAENHPYDIQILGDDRNLYPTYVEDCEYISAADPPTILRLIDALRSR